MCEVVSGGDRSELPEEIGDPPGPASHREQPSLVDVGRRMEAILRASMRDTRDHLDMPHPEVVRDGTVHVVQRVEHELADLRLTEDAVHERRCANVGRAQVDVLALVPALDRDVDRLLVQQPSISDADVIGLEAVAVVALGSLAERIVDGAVGAGGIAGPGLRDDQIKLDPQSPDREPGLHQPGVPEQRTELSVSRDQLTPDLHVVKFFDCLGSGPDDRSPDPHPLPQFAGKAEGLEQDDFGELGCHK